MGDDGNITEMNIVSADLLLPGGITHSFSNVLCDTGASANYISLKLFNEFKRLYNNSIVPVNKQVRLGDGKTIKDISFGIDVDLRFTDVLEYDTKGGTKPAKQHNVTIFCHVFDMGHDIIIGSFSLASVLYDFFIEHLRLSRNSLFDVDPNLNALQEGILVRPFKDMLIEAPEDASTEMPGHFRESLYALTVEYNERVKDFYTLFDSHVSAEFAAQTDVINLLRGIGTKVFVHENWDGINQIDPIEFETRADLPTSHFCKARPINPKLRPSFDKEFERLKTYNFVPSTSPIVSPIVVAPKATSPYIRFCGDFSWLNPYFIMPQVTIQNVLKSLGKIANYKYFIDLDVTNAFHQFRLGERTSNLLSIITPTETVRPKFMLEGTTPATGILHSNMCTIFKDFDVWSIVLFDNILLLANSYEDAYEKLEKFLLRCVERNIFLKFEKSFLGVQEVNFFGYVCRHKEYCLSGERVKSILEIPFPTSTKQMQSFLGSCLFFKSFIPNYSTHAAILNDMTHKSFQWVDETAWKSDYRIEFDALKEIVANSFKLFYPNYDLPWILRVDASKLGVGSVLLQDCDGVLQPIMFQSSKFSKQAVNWSTIEQECYAIYYSVHSLDYYLRCKHFIIETDHRNLIWMNASIVPKIIRWHIYLQSFNFLIRHIPGKQNIVADMLSRQWPTTPVKEFEEALQDLAHISDPELVSLDFDVVMREVHGWRTGHLGSGRTWKLLNKRYPLHTFSAAMVKDYVAECPVCQKARLIQVASIPPSVKTLHVEHARSMVGVDTLEICLADDGMRYLLVLVNFFTRFVYLYPVANKDALTTASCIFHYICTFGLFDLLRSDPGSDFTSEVMTHLLKWLGPTRSLTLVNRPQADGVEGTNKQLLRHLTAICMDEHCKKQWSHRSILPIIQLIVNEHVSSETGVVPFHAQFGENDAIYGQIPAGLPPDENTHEYVRLLADNLKKIRAISAKFQATVEAERVAKSPPESIHKYAKGDYVCYKITANNRKDKLTPRNAGPYRVISHNENWVEVQDIIGGAIKTYDQSDLGIFWGTEEEAFNMAQKDNDQYVVEKLLAYRGDPMVRTTMEFLVRFADGTEVWKRWNNDLDNNDKYESYCRSLPQLSQMLLNSKEAAEFRLNKKKELITLVTPKTEVYVDLREMGPFDWYAGLNLPDKNTLTYVYHVIYKDYCGPKSNPTLKIKAFYPLTRKTFDVDNWFVYCYGHKFKTLQSDHVLLTKELMKEYKLKL